MPIEELMPPAILVRQSLVPLEDIAGQISETLLRLATKVHQSSLSETKS